MNREIENALEYLHLEEELRAFCKGRRFLFVVNPGNWGDGLIAAGTLAFFRSRGFDFVAIPFRAARKAPQDRLRKLVGHKELLFVFSGNGAFLPQYMQTRRFPDMVRRCDRMFILPSTFPLDPAQLEIRDTDVAFRRDQSGSSQHAPDLPFCHDMAFCLGRIEAGQGSGTGMFFREDSEGPKGFQIPKDNLDLSKQGTESTPVNGFFQHLAAFETIYTNRLHVAIGGCLLGREVHMFANSYFKNEAIYRSSLEDWFDKIHFHGASALTEVVEGI